MSSEEAVRRYLINRLGRYDRKAAEYLAEEMDESYLKKRVRELKWWATGWRMLIWPVLLGVGLIIMLAPVAGYNDSFFFAGLAIFLGLGTTVYSWERKREVYEALTVMADPEYELESPFH